MNIVLRKNSIMGLKQTGRIFTPGFLFLVLVKCNISFTFRLRQIIVYMLNLLFYLEFPE